MTEEQKKEKLFQEGLLYFSKMYYFEAHEEWEDLWSDYYLEDRKFIQGLIQLSVSFVHVRKGNIKGAKSQLGKCSEKFQQFSGIHRGINVSLLLTQIEKVRITYNELINLKDFDWTLVPTLE